MSEKSVAQVLNEAAEIVERGWAQGDFALDQRGMAVPADDPEACRWCAEGAIRRVAARGTVWPAITQTERAIGELSLAMWNDAPDRTQAEVVAKLREAAALALSQEGTR